VSRLSPAAPTATAAARRNGGGDYVLPFQIEGPGIRGRLVRLTASLGAIVGGHGYPPALTRLVGEALAMATVLASGLKYDGIFTLQLQGDGPVGLVVCDITSSGDLRAYARFDADRLGDGGDGGGTAGPAAAAAPVPRLLGAGHMVFTVDQGPATERYQGITLLEGATLGECCHAYFRQSEQLATAVLIAAGRGPVPAAAALMLQRLPDGPERRLDDDAADADDDAWRRAVALLSSLGPAELLADTDDEALLYRLFHEDGVRVYRQRPLRHRCRCSRRKVERTLASFPAAEIRAMCDPDGRLTVTCEFCKATYALDDQDIARLHADDSPP
jgi:molecular chaperone Hsp33